MKPVPLEVEWVFDRAAARAVDRAAAAEYGIPSIVLMENAARALAESAQALLVRGSPHSVLIICGSGNNGGDGYAVARHLHNDGCAVEVLAIGEPRQGTDATINREICRRMDLPISNSKQSLQGAPERKIDLIVDAIFGTGLDRPVGGEAQRVIKWINAQDCPVLAADIASGLDCDTGQVLGCCVRATRTVTFVGIKRGFLNPAAREWLGEVVIGDIGVPVELIKRLGVRIDNQ